MRAGRVAAVAAVLLVGVIAIGYMTTRFGNSEGSASPFRGQYYTLHPQSKRLHS